MRAGQGELGLAMVEGRAPPPRGRVAELAVGGEPARHMRRIVGTLEIGLVAAIAVRGRVVVVAIGVALRARNGRVLSGQRPLCIERVIELGIVPVHSGVAGCAIAW